MRVGAGEIGLAHQFGDLAGVPAVARNGDSILARCVARYPGAAPCRSIVSGSGEHAVNFAAVLPQQLLAAD